jgi:hypothetical protein
VTIIRSDAGGLGTQSHARPVAVARQRFAGIIVDRASRLLLLVLLLAFAAWRLVRYLKLGMRKRPVSVASGAGMMVQTAAPAPDSDPTGASTVSVSRFTVLGILIGVTFWLGTNVIIVLMLFGLPHLRDLPPIVLLVAIVLGNFYLIPRARHLADGWGSRKSPIT